MSESVQVCLDSRERVFALVTAMAGMVEGAVDQAIEAFLQGDSELARVVLQKETVVNSMEIHIDAAVLDHLARKDAPSEDSRSMASILKINKDLQRMGDLAANVGRNVIEIGVGWEECQRSELQPLAIAVSHVCRKALRALLHRDVVLAESALNSKEAVYHYRDYAFRRIRERSSCRSSDLGADLTLLLASRYLEQIATCAENLAANMVFWMRGETCRELLAG